MIRLGDWRIKPITGTFSFLEVQSVSRKFHLLEFTEVKATESERLGENHDRLNVEEPK